MATVIGVPKEIKDMEGRVSMQPDGVAELVHHGHEVYVQAGAGEGSGFTDEEYDEAGARVVDGPDEVFESSDLIVKVKEPVPEEYDRFSEGQQLFTYLHLAADKGLTEFLMERKINSIAYETVESSDGSLPLLTPMSEVAGRMSIQAAAHHLESPQGGAGLLLGGVPGTPAAKVTIIGGGVVGTEAAKIAVGMRAMVNVMDVNPKRLAYLSDIFGGRIDLVIPNRARTSDHALGAHLRRGGRHPLLRGEHPRGGGPDLHAGAYQRHPPLPAQDRRRGSGGSGFVGPGAGEGPLHSGRQSRLRAGRRGPRPAPHRPREAPE